MSELSKTSTRTKILAAIAIFSAIYAVLRIVPTVPMIGVEGAYFSLSDILAPIYGIILGPYVGGTSVIIGTFIGMSAKPPVFLGLDFLPAFVNAVALGFLVKRKWLPVVLLDAVLIIAFVANPLTLNFVNISLGNMSISLPFIWMHIVAFIVLVSPWGHRASQWIEAKAPKKNIAGFAMLAFVGTMMQHLTGNILYENIFVHVTHFFSPEALMVKWNLVFFLYPWERLILIVMAVVVGLPLYRVVKTTLFTSKVEGQQ